MLFDFKVIDTTGAGAVTTNFTDGALCFQNPEDVFSV